MQKTTPGTRCEFRKPQSFMPHIPMPKYTEPSWACLQDGSDGGNEGLSKWTRDLLSQKQQATNLGLDCQSTTPYFLRNCSQPTSSHQSPCNQPHNIHEALSPHVHVCPRAFATEVQRNGHATFWSKEAHDCYMIDKILYPARSSDCETQNRGVCKGGPGHSKAISLGSYQRALRHVLREI